MNYICIRSWVRNTKGDTISDWEYKKLPIEIKEYFESIQSIVEFEKQIVEDEVQNVTVNRETLPQEFEVAAPQNPFAHKKKKFEATADINKIIDSE